MWQEVRPELRVIWSGPKADRAKRLLIFFSKGGCWTYTKSDRWKNCVKNQDGCDKEVLFEALQGHEKHCNFRPHVQCVKSDCKKLFKRSNYLSHMATYHQAQASGAFHGINILEYLKSGKKIRCIVPKSSKKFAVKSTPDPVLLGVDALMWRLRECHLKCCVPYILALSGFHLSQLTLIH